MKEIKMTKSMWQSLKFKEKAYYLWCGFMVLFIDTLIYVATTICMVLINAILFGVIYGISELILRFALGIITPINEYVYAGAVALSILLSWIRVALSGGVNNITTDEKEK